MRKVLLLLLFALGISWAQAAYLRNVPVTVTQPDGTKLECFASGDEFYNYLHDAEGFTIIQDQHTGFYVYADLKNDELVSTTLIAGKDNPAGKLTPNLNISSEKRMQMRKAWEIPERYRVEQTRTGEANHGKLNNISIFIRFSDDPEFMNTYSSINNMFNDSTASAVSMYNYFKEASYGQVYVPTTFYPGHSGETIISYQDAHARGFFQPYNAVTNTSGYQTDAERATREFDLLERAVNYVNTNNPVPSSLNIDYDSDGYVDNVCFIVRGNVGDWGSLLWPHKWNLYDRTVYINGKVVNVFNFQLADATYYFNTSTMCHEMNHSFGAPDLYHYNDSYDDLAPVGPWDLMEQNATPPQHMGAYMKYKYGNWIDEIPEITSSGTYTLNDLSSSTNNCYKIASGVSGQYYVLEYRKKSVETTLPGSGLLIYRINTAFTGNADYDPGSGEYDEVYLYRPGGTTSANGNIYNAYFSSGSGRTAFHAGTNPQPFYTDGSVDNDLMITNITAAGNTISFTYSAGFHVAPDNVSIHPTGGSPTVTFESGPETSTWTASSNQSWLTVSPASGNGSGSINTITLSANANTTNNSRTAVVTFSQAGNTATVTVSQDVVAQGNFSYDFEACTDFAVDDFPPCTTYDGDGFSTIGFSGFNYPNKFYTGSFIAYNESQASGSSGFEAHQGSKIGACFRSNGVQNNDWLITPMISLKSNSQLSFYAKTFLDQYGLERFRVLISTTSNAPSDFTLISSGEYVEAPTSWTQYTYDLSAYDGQSIYIAIQCVSNSALAFLIDDISVTSVETMPEDHYWQPITTAQADWEGNYLITYSNPALSTVKALSGENSNYGVGTEIFDHYNQDGFISLDALTFGMRVTVEETSAGKYSLYLNEVGYLGWSSANSLRFDSDVTANQNEWLISVSGGIVTLTSANDATRKLKWNASSPRFACYTSAQTDITLFKLVPIPNPVVVINAPESSYCPAQTITLNANFSLGQSPYVTTWGGDLTVENETLASSSTSATFILPPVCDTSYHITLYVTDANGRVSAISGVDINILDTTAPTINGTVANQNALAGVNCEWIYPDVRELVRALSSDNCISTDELIITQLPVQNTPIVGSGNGTITVMVTDVCGNSTSTEVIIVVPEMLSILGTTYFNLNCYGAENGFLSMFIIGGRPPYTYTLTGQETATSGPIATTQYTFEELSAGDYTITASDAAGCEVSINLTLTQPDELLVNIDSVEEPSCFGLNDGHAVAHAVGGVAPYSYEWNTDPASTGQYCGGLGAGSYTVTVTDANNCVTTAAIVIDGPEPVVVNLDNHQNPICHGEQNGWVQAVITGGNPDYTYNWSNGNTTSYIDNLTAGTYTLTVIDNNGCDATSSITLTDPEVLSLSITDQHNASCYGVADGGATVHATGGVGPFSYLWEPSGQTTNIAQNLGAGVYTVTVTDANDCVATDTVVIVDPEQLVLTIDNYQNPVCHGGQSGWAEAVVTGGTPGYTYSWSNGSTTSNIDNLTAGTYTLTVIDNNGCEATGSVTLTEPEAITLSITDQQNASCYGVADGEATVLVVGGVEPLSYLWEPSGQTTNMAQNLAAGVYAVTVTDANGCEASTTVNITQPDGLTPGSISSQGEQVCDGDDPNEIISISNATSGQQDFVYRWKQNGVVISNSNVNAYNPGVLPVGTYVFTREVMDVCTDWTASEGAWTVEMIENPEIVITGDFLIESGESTTLTAAGAEHYLWSTGETTASITVSPLVPTTYSVVGTNGVSCSAEEEVTVEILPNGISENSMHDLQLYPNPTKNDVKVICKDMKRASIMTLTGQVMSFEDVNADEATLSFRSYSSGIYMVKIETNDGVVLMRRVTLTK